VEDNTSRFAGVVSLIDCSSLKVGLFTVEEAVGVFNPEEFSGFLIAEFDDRFKGAGLFSSFYYLYQ
jgi:hypothetical protein